MVYETSIQFIYLAHAQSMISQWRQFLGCRPLWTWADDEIYDTHNFVASQAWKAWFSLYALTSYNATLPLGASVTLLLS